MPDYAWPDAQHRTLIGKRTTRVDSAVKVSGQAKYTYDVHRPGMLYGKVLRCPYAHAKVVSIDTSAAEKMPGVEAVHIVQGPGANIHWAGDDIVAVAAVDEPTAEDAIRAIKVEFQQLPHLVSDAEPPKGSAQEEGPLSIDAIDDMLDNQVPANQMVSTIQRDGLIKKASEDELKMLKADGATDAVLEAVRSATMHPEASSKPPSNYQKAAAQTVGDPDKAFAEAEVVSEGLYGIPVITHCCLESHGSISEWTDPEHLFTHISTQNVSGIPGQMAEPLNIPATNIRVHQDNIGGGFGSKFSPDRWGIFTAEVSKKAGGKPVRIMLERDIELKVAGARPSAYARVKVAADTLGIPMDTIQLQIGDTTYPPSGGSGGSTTIGGVSSSTRRAAVDARDALFAKVAPALNVQSDQLECGNGKVGVKGDSSRSLGWKEACSKLGAMPLTVRGKNPDRSKPPDLTNSGVGGVQMAEVEVDTDTGIVKVKKMVAVQDCGLVIDVKTAESQCHGALIMGISYSLFEEKVMDPTTGRMLNPDMQYYRLAGLNDIPELVVHMMTGKGYDERGVIGLGEPPVISPGAAISNAVANAIGLRVPFLPLTPDRVIAALQKGGTLA